MEDCYLCNLYEEKIEYECKSCRKKTKYAPYNDVFFKNKPNCSA
jgi:hypothetical protein